MFKTMTWKQSKPFSIVRTGTFNASSGRVDITLEILNEVVASFKNRGSNEADLPVVQRGHEAASEELPRRGNIKDLWVDTGVLMGRGEFDPQLYSDVKSKSWPGRSAGIKKGVDGKHFLEHLAILGGSSPAVTNLEPIQFSANSNGALEIQFFSNEKIESINPEGVQKMNEALKKKLISAGLTAEEFTILLAEHPVVGSAPPVETQANPGGGAAADATQAVETAEVITEVVLSDLEIAMQTIMDLRAELQTLKEKIATLEGPAQTPVETTAAPAATANEATLKALTSTGLKFVAQKKITQAQHDLALSVYNKSGDMQLSMDCLLEAGTANDRLMLSQQIGTTGDPSVINLSKYRKIAEEKYGLKDVDDDELKRFLKRNPKIQTESLELTH